MDTRTIDAQVRDLGRHLHEVEHVLAPQAFLLDCIGSTTRLAGCVPAELRGYLAQRLDPVLSEYALDAARLLRAP